MNVTMKTHTDYDMEHLEELQWVLGKTIMKKPFRRKRISGLISGGLCVAIGFALAIRHGSVMLSLVCCVLGALLLSQSIFSNFFSAWSASRAMKRRGISNEFHFQRNEILAVCGDVSSRFAYTSCMNLMETDVNLYFIMDSGQGLMLDKRNVRGGSVDELRAMLQEKSGKDVLWVSKKGGDKG